MTTIAYTNGIIAADTLVTGCNGNVRDSFTSKIRKNHRLNLLAGTAGGAILGQQFLSWFDKLIVKDYSSFNKLEFDRTDESFEACIIDDNTIIYFEAKGFCVSQLRHGMFALGSGHQCALGAMYRGAEAYDAVIIACVFDVYSGGNIETLGFDNE